MPAYYKWIIGWSYWLIAVGLCVALYRLLKTFTTYLNTKKLKKLTSELQTSLRRYLIIFTISYIGVSLLVVIAYHNDWNFYVDPSDWSFPVQIAEFALEVGYDVLAIWLLVQLHHRHFKPRRKKKVTVTYEDEEEEESDEEHVSVYEDDATSLASGTVRHDDNQSLLGQDEKFKGTLFAALAGQVDFDGPQRYRANTGGEKMKLAKSELVTNQTKDDNSIEQEKSPITFRDVDNNSDDGGARISRAIKVSKDNA